MSIFSMANPGGGNLKPYGDKAAVDSLFSGGKGRLDGSVGSDIEMFMSGRANIKCVKVHIFNLSDASERSEYEKLWADLLKKMSCGSVVVDSHSDLVKDKDGTSYWMKYVEYVEFEPAPSSIKEN